MTYQDRDSHDQAEMLREKMEEQHANKSSLPPRSTVHKKEKSKVKWKIKYPLIRLLTIIFILLVILIPSYSILKERGNESNPTAGNMAPTNTFEIAIETAPKSAMEADENRLPMEEAENEAEADMNGQLQAEESYEQVSEQVSAAEVETEINEEFEADNGYITHIVQRGENLYRISLKYFNDRSGEEIIKKANGLNDSTVYVGQRLKIPMK